MPDIDLLITDDDLVVADDGAPMEVSGRLCVAQDIRHMIREKGYAVEMIGNRNQVEVAALAKKIEIEMEKDERLVPGTALVTQTDTSEFVANAETWDYGVIKLGLSSLGIVL